MKIRIKGAWKFEVRKVESGNVFGRTVFVPGARVEWRGEDEV
jgi:hypothetical protein